jgi:hypothetical protein
MDDRAFDALHEIERGLPPESQGQGDTDPTFSDEEFQVCEATFMFWQCNPIALTQLLRA